MADEQMTEGAWLEYVDSLDKRTSERGFSFLEPLDDRDGEPLAATESREGSSGAALLPA